METEYHQATTKGKVIFISLMLFGITLVLSAEHLATTLFENTSFTSSLNLPQIVLLFGIISFFFYLFGASFLNKYSKRIIQHTQYPPPDSNIPFKVKILRGEKALKQAKHIHFGSLFFTFLGFVKLGAAIYFYTVLTEIT